MCELAGRVAITAPAPTARSGFSKGARQLGQRVSSTRAAGASHGEVPRPHGVAVRRHSLKWRSSSCASVRRSAIHFGPRAQSRSVASQKRATPRDLSRGGFRYNPATGNNQDRTGRADWSPSPLRGENRPFRPKPKFCDANGRVHGSEGDNWARANRRSAADTTHRSHIRGDHL